MQFVMFSKVLGCLTVEEAAQRVREIGFDGLDLTVRPKGHVEPERVRELPEVVERVRALGCDVPMITTGITCADQPYAEDTFQAAADSGIRELKLGYWQYQGFGHVRHQLDEWRRDLHGLEALARHTGVRANVHNHSGNFLCADGAIVWMLLEGRDPECIGAYIDPGHLTIEGGGSGWCMALDLLSPWVRLVAIKCMGWQHAYDEQLGQERWWTQMVPLRQGTVPWLEFFRYLRLGGFDGIVSMHSPYQGKGSWRDLSTEELLAQTAEELAYIKYIVRRVEREMMGQGTGKREA
jgi:sugar phosphate isomerase/epimerase